MAKNLQHPTDVGEITAKIRTGDLEGADLSNLSLKKADLSSGRLKQADLSRSSLKKANLAGADLSGANLTRADLTDADLTGADLSGANLTEAVAKNVQFDNCNATGAILTGANLAGATWKGSDLSSANLNEAILAKGLFDSTRLSGAALQDADATDSEWVGVDLQGADLTHACFQNCRIEKFNAPGLSAAHSDFSLSSVSSADFSNSNFEGADFANTLLERVSFAKANLTHALFNVSEHNEVDFSDAQLGGASLKSISGYSEEQIEAFKQRGAAVDLFLIRRFFRLLLHSAIAKLILVAVLGILGTGIYFYLSNPANWSFEKLDRVAQVYNGQNRYDQAVELYRIIIQKFPNSNIKIAHAKNQIGRLCIEMQKFDQADALFQEVLADYPDLENAVILARMGLAQNLAAQKKSKEAISAYNEIAALYPDFPQAVEAKDRIAKILLSEGKSEEARKIYEEIKSAYADNLSAVVQAEFDIADLLRSQGKNEDALAKYRQVYQTHKEDPKSASRALCNVLQMQVILDRPDEAEATLRQIVAEFPDDINSYLDSELFIANNLASRKKHKEAEERLSKVYREHRESMQGYWAGYSLVDLYSQTGRYAEAQTLLTELSDRWGDQERFKAQFELKAASILQSQQKYQEAIDRVNALTPQLTDPEYILNAELLLAELQAGAGQYPAAEETYRRILEKFADNSNAVASALLGQARILEIQKDIPGALARLQKVIDTSINPGPVFDAQFSQVRIYRANRNAAEAERVLSEAIQRHQAIPERQILAKMTLAELYRDQRKYPEAEALLRPIADLENTLFAVNALTSLVRVYTDQKMIEQAEAVSREIAERFPSARQGRFDAELDTANSILTAGDTEEALKRFLAVAEQGEESQRQRAYLSILQIYTEKEDLPRARETYEKLMALPSVDSEHRVSAKLAMANFLRQKNQYEESDGFYQELIAEYAGKIPQAWALSNLAQSYIEQNQFDQALRTYDRILADFSQNPEFVVKAYLGKGSVQELNKQYGEALALYEKAVGMAVAQADILTARGAEVRLKAALGEIDEADRLFAELKEKYPAEADLLESMDFSIAGSFAAKGDFPNAIDRLKKIRATTGNKVNKGNASLSLANLYQSIGRLDQALAEYRQVLTDYPDDINLRRGASLGVAQVYLTQKQYAKAIAQFEQILEQFTDVPTRVQSLTQLSRTYFDQGMIEKAETTYKRLETEGADNPNALYELHSGLGEIAQRSGDYDRALERFQQAFKAAPTDSQKLSMLTSMAQVYTSQGKFDQARETYRQIEENFKENQTLLIDAKIGQAAVLEQNRLYEEAIGIYREVMQTARDAATVSLCRIAIARIYAGQQKVQEAEREFQEILDQFGTNPSVALQAYNGLASLYGSQGRNDEALATYEKIEKLASDDAMRLGALDSQARILFEKNRLDDAEALFRRIQKEAVYNPNARFSAEMGLADVDQKRGHHEKALKRYEELNQKALDENQRLAAMNAIAQIHMNTGDYAAAEADFRSMAARFSNNRNARIDAELGLANALREAKKYPEAEKLYSEIVTRYENAIQSYWAYMGLAQIQAMEGRIDDAARVYETAAQKFPENSLGVADAQLNLANLLKNANRRAEALAAYDVVIAKFANQIHGVWALQGKAQIYNEAGDMEKAEQMYDEIIQKHGKNPEAVADARLGKARLLENAGKTKQAIEIYRQLIRDVPKAKAQEAQMAVAYALLTLQELEEAEKEFKKILREYADIPAAVHGARIGLGEVEMGRGQFGKAAALFEEAAKKARDSSEASWALQSLARALIEEKRFTETDSVVERLIRTSPGDSNAVINIQLNKASKLRSLKQYDEALRILDPLIEKFKGQPQTAWVEHAKAQTLTEQQNYEEATKVYTRIIETYSSNRTAIVDAKLNLGMIQFYQGYLDEAKAMFENLVEAYPEFQQTLTALFTIAQIEEQRNNPEGAEAIYKRILERFDGNQTAVINANMALANLYNNQAKFDLAERHYRNIYERFPDNNQAGWAISGAARAQIELGNEGEAERLLKMILEKFPNETPIVEGAKATLEELYKR